MLDGILESMDMSLRKLLRYFALPILFQYKSPILWPPDVKNWLIGKHPDAGKDWRQEEKGMTENEMAGWHHRLSGHEFDQALGVGDGQGSLASCSPLGRKELGIIEWLNWEFTNILNGSGTDFLENNTAIRVRMMIFWPKMKMTYKILHPFTNCSFLVYTHNSVWIVKP